MLIFLAVAGGFAALYGLHRLALWAENRGWIFYLHKKASPDSLGNAVLGVQQLLQPGAQHVLEARQDKHAEQEASGGGDTPGR